MSKLLSNPEFLKTLPTLAAAGIGSAVPGALPGAAGFAGGFEEAKTAQQERQDKLDIASAKELKKKENKPVYILDDNNNPVQVGEVPGDAVFRSQGLSATDFASI